MIVFTVTCRATEEVFVGSTRSTPEDRWVQLCTQAADETEGSLFDAIRTYGDEGFQLDEWGEAETPAEARTLTREAQEQLCALPILSNSGSKASGKAGKPTSLRDIEKMLVEIRDGTSEWDDEPLATERAENGMTAETGKSTQAAIHESVPTEASLKLATGRASSSAKEKRVREALEKQRGEQEQLRQTRSTEEADEIRKVLLSIESRRLSQKKSAPKKKKVAKKKTTTEKVIRKTSTNTAARVATNSPTKIATGRAKSSEKERRIREALQKEREERLAKQQAQAAAEADEMAAILAKIDNRSKQVSKQKRRR